MLIPAIPHRYLLPVLLLLLLGCNQSDTDFGFGGTQQVQPETVSTDRAVDTGTEVIRRLIRRGYVAYETDDVARTRVRVQEAVARFDGYIINDESNSSERRTGSTLEIRVSADQFDSLLVAVTAGVAHFDQQRLTLDDVTEEFLDVSARLTTKKALEARYLELLQRASTVANMLAIERQIGKLRAEIESTEGRLRYLESQVALATLTVSFYKKHPTGSALGERLQDGLANGWQLLVSFLVLLVHCWPFLLLALVLGWLWRRRRRTIQNGSGIN